MLRQAVLVACLAIPGCGSAGDRGPARAEVRMLFMGNSHASLHGLPQMVAAMIAGVEERRVSVVEAPGWRFLDERAGDPATLALLRGGRWQFVVLQAQRTSASWRTTYSTEGAESLVRAVRAAGAVPVLFPEWPRRGVDETGRILGVHEAIAARAPACVAPVGPAFDRARAVYPELALYAEDGNHASAAGAFLAALVLAAAITGASPEAVPYLPQFPVSSDVQHRLRAVATRTFSAAPVRCR